MRELALTIDEGWAGAGVGGTVNEVAGEVNRPGIRRLSVDLVALNNRANLRRGLLPFLFSAASIRHGFGAAMRLDVAPTAGVDFVVGAGLLNDNRADTALRRLALWADSSSANWRVASRDGGATTFLPTAVPVTSWADWRVDVVGAVSVHFVNGLWVGNLPVPVSGTLGANMSIVGLTGVGVPTVRNLDSDYFFEDLPIG